MLVRSSMISVLRTAAISAAYLVAWIGLDLLATSYGHDRGALSPWYFGAALTFYLVYTFGVRYAGLAVVAEVLRPLLLPPSGAHTSLLFYVLFGTIAAIGYAATAWFLRDVVRARVPFAGFRDASLYCAAVTWVPLALSLPLVALVCAFGRAPWAQYFSQVATFWVGDCVGLIVAVPALALYLTPRVAQSLVSPQVRDHATPIKPVLSAWLFVFLVGAIALGYAAVPLGITNDPLLFLTFVPLMMLAASGGLRLAIPGILVADAVTTALNALVPNAMLHPVSLQSYIIVSAMASILIGAIVDARYRKERKNRLLAAMDPLTGLPNRESLEHWIANAPTPLTLVMLDVDRFRLTNEGVSREAGNTLLRAIAERLQNVGATYLAHVSADEFVCAFVNPEIDRMALAKRVAGYFEQPFDAREAHVYASVSLGVAETIDPGERNQLLRQASIAMYRAKHGGGGRIAVYSDELAESVQSVSLASELFSALHDGELELFYQPIFDLDQGDCRCIGAEALLRWNHPRLGLIGPAQFLDLLETLTLADRVGAWVIEEAARQASAWNDRGLELQVWINLFPRQALDREVATLISRALDRYDLPADRIVVEVTERVVASDEAEVADAIHALAQRGLRTAIDDFGTGHSSLARLRDISAHILKIDRTFIHDSEMNAKARSMVQAVLTIASELQIVPLAEGIENRGQLELVRTLGCRLAQGYYLGLPMRANELQAWLEEVSAIAG